jgi:glycosyltransferase involved in cell wall biosynthesis
VKIALVIGPCPPGVCGVGDYTTCLSNALKASGAEIHVITSGDWNLLGVFKLSRRLREQKFDIVHIEYPTVGFGTKLNPQGLSLLQRCVVTIHEASQRHILRKLALFPFAVRPEHIIFTNRFERRFARRWAPWIARASSVIPVGSNIAVSAGEGPRTLNEIVYFGLIIPGKGLEEVLELGNRIRSAGLPLVVRIIGRVPLKYAAYCEELRLKTEGLPIVWDHDLSEEETAKRLAGSTIAYLPYPDGASERRATLKAALLSGLAVITTRGPHTPRNLGGVVRFCQSPEEALAAIRCLVESPEETSRMAAKAVQYGQRYSWERIAKLHLRVYDSVMSKRSSHSTIQTEDTKLLGRLDSKSDM